MQFGSVLFDYKKGIKESIRSDQFSQSKVKNTINIAFFEL